jgi:hypothetical protein
MLRLAADQVRCCPTLVLNAARKSERGDLERPDSISSNLCNLFRDPAPRTLQPARISDTR